MDIRAEMLPDPQDDLRRRRWIWSVLSDLFLDDEQDNATYERIAYVAANCGFSKEDLELIYRREVAPAIAFNLVSAAGTWGYFDSIWLETRILVECNRRLSFGRFFLAPIAIRMNSQKWNHVLEALDSMHERVAEERSLAGESWRPLCDEEAPHFRWESKAGKIETPKIGN